MSLLNSTPSFHISGKQEDANVPTDACAPDINPVTFTTSSVVPQFDFDKYMDSVLEQSRTAEKKTLAQRKRGNHRKKTSSVTPPSLALQPLGQETVDDALDTLYQMSVSAESKRLKSRRFHYKKKVSGNDTSDCGNCSLHSADSEIFTTCDQGKALDSSREFNYCCAFSEGYECHDSASTRVAEHPCTDNLDSSSSKGTDHIRLDSEATDSLKEVKNVENDAADSGISSLHPADSGTFTVCDLGTDFDSSKELDHSCAFPKCCEFQDSASMTGAEHPCIDDLDSDFNKGACCIRLDSEANDNSQEKKNTGTDKRHHKKRVKTPYERRTKLTYQKKRKFGKNSEGESEEKQAKRQRTLAEPVKGVLHERKAKAGTRQHRRLRKTSASTGKPSHGSSTEKDICPSVSVTSERGKKRKRESSEKSVFQREKIRHVESVANTSCARSRTLKLSNTTKVVKPRASNCSSKRKPVKAEVRKHSDVSVYVKVKVTKSSNAAEKGRSKPAKRAAVGRVRSNRHSDEMQSAKRKAQKQTNETKLVSKGGRAPVSNRCSGKSTSKTVFRGRIAGKFYEASNAKQRKSLGRKAGKCKSEMKTPAEVQNAGKRRDKSKSVCDKNRKSGKQVSAPSAGHCGSKSKRSVPKRTSKRSRKRPVDGASGETIPEEVMQQQRVLAHHQNLAAASASGGSFLARLRHLEALEWTRPRSLGLAELHRQMPLVPRSWDGASSTGQTDSCRHAGGVWKLIVPER